MSIPISMLTLIDTATETVKQSLESFVENGLESNPDALSGALVSEVSRALEASFAEAGRAALKALIEPFDCKEETIERDGRTYRLKDEASKKTFLSGFGDLELARSYYHCYLGGAGIVPLDEAWDMQGKRYAVPEVVENVLWASAIMVPSEVEKFCARMCSFQPSTSCIQDIISRDGAGIADMLEAENEGVACREIKVPEATEVVAFSLDGTTTLLRNEGNSDSDDSDGEGQDKLLSDGGDEQEQEQPNGGYKHAMVGSFSFYRQIDGLVDIENGTEGIVPHRLGSMYCARMPEEKAPGFKKEFEAIVEEIITQLADNAGIEKLILIDGARPLWNYVENHPQFAGLHMLLDFFHGAEHLSLLAAALFEKGSKKAERWYEKWRFNLKYEKGAVDGILRSAAYYRKTLRLPKRRDEEVEREVTFFKGNQERMNYHEHVAKGWPIGSGVVEAACKTIVKQRLCQSGMRWNRKGGRNVLALRVLYESEQWDNAWNQYRSERWLKQQKPKPRKHATDAAA